MWYRIGIDQDIIIIIIIIIIIDNIDASFPINILKNKILCCPMMDTAGLRVPPKQIRDFFACNVSNISRLSPSTGCVRASNICKSLDVFNKHDISLEDTFSFA
jgi:hypothetical protein